MNQVATIEKPTRLDEFRMQVLPPERKAEIIRALPAHVKPERFERNLVNALMQTPELMELDPRLIFREVSKAAALGLYLDPQLGEAYMIAGWNGKAKRKEPQLRIGYRGLIKLGRQSGEITMIYAHEVHANDTFECSLGDHKSLLHKPNVFGDRGPIVGYYAVVKYQDGESDFEPMTIQQVHDIRDRSDGWQAFKAGKIRSTPWSTDETEMAKKTAIRRLVKRIPQSPELADAMTIEDAAEHSDMRTAAVSPPSPPSPPSPRTIEHDAKPAEKPAEARRPAETDSEPSEPADATESAPEQPDDALPPIRDYDAQIEDWIGQIASAEDAGILNEVWATIVDYLEEPGRHVLPPDIERLRKAYADKQEHLG
ncbi:MAG: recombinase RecT [Flavobacteriaceae bacterium]